MRISRRHMIAKNASVSFAYDEDAVIFDVRLTPESGGITIAGDKNSLIALAESFTFCLALDPEGKDEHDHWRTSDGSDVNELMTSLNNSFTGGHSMIDGSDEDEIISRPSILIECPDPIDANIVIYPSPHGHVDILADNSGMSVMANALLRLLQFDDMAEISVIAEADQSEWGYNLIQFVLKPDSIGKA